MQERDRPVPGILGWRFLRATMFWKLRQHSSRQRGRSVYLIPDGRPYSGQVSSRRGREDGTLCLAAACMNCVSVALAFRRLRRWSMAPESIRSLSPLAYMRLKLREFVWETQFFAKLGRTWSERMSIAKFMMMLYVARLMPFSTRKWEATIVVRGARYVIGVRTSEIFVFHEIYNFFLPIQQASRIRPAWRLDSF
jgi:hypothetical protein